MRRVKNKIIDKTNTPSRSAAKTKQPMTPKTPKSASKREGSKTPKIKMGDTVNGVSMVCRKTSLSPKDCVMIASLCVYACSRLCRTRYYPRCTACRHRIFPTRKSPISSSGRTQR